MSGGGIRAALTLPPSRTAELTAPPTRTLPTLPPGPTQFYTDAVERTTTAGGIADTEHRSKVGPNHQNVSRRTLIPSLQQYR